MFRSLPGRLKDRGGGGDRENNCRSQQILIACLGFTVRLRFPSEILEHNRARRESTLVQHFHGALSWKTKIVSIWKCHEIYCSELYRMHFCQPSEVVKTNRNVRWHWVQSDKVHFCHLFTVQYSTVMHYTLTLLYYTITLANMPSETFIFYIFQATFKHKKWVSLHKVNAQVKVNM